MPKLNVIYHTEDARFNTGKFDIIFCSVFYVISQCTTPYDSLSIYSNCDIKTKLRNIKIVMKDCLRE